MKNIMVLFWKVSTLLALLLSTSELKGQNVNPVFTPDLPPSPQAVAFNRLGDYQINNNYGMPDISIPLFEIDHHGYKIPLSLHYEASPMKPGYNYDVTGMGWTLSGNSCVSRTIKDRADEYGLFSNPFELDPFTNKTGQMKRYMDYADNLNQLNFQYDSYNIVLPTGRTIPFFMYKAGGILQYHKMSQDSNVKITCSYSQNSIDSFEVTDENGITYWFTLAEKASNGFNNDFNAERNVTWLLTDISIPSKGLITYEYTDLQTIHTYTVSEPVIRVSRMISERIIDSGERRFNVMKSLQSQSPQFKMRFLSSIHYGPTRVNFNYTADGKHMKEIVVSDRGEQIRKFKLGIDEWTTPRGALLDSIVITGKNDNDKLVYGFSYTTAQSSGNYTDYWGNICDSNMRTDLGNFNMFIDIVGLDSSSIKAQLENDGNPARYIRNKPDDPSCYYKLKLQSELVGDTRHASLPQFHNVLTSITYPNGGRTVFNWENHRFPTATAADGDFIFDRRQQRIMEGGGFRIESITNWAADGTASADYFRYGYTFRDIKQRNFPLPLPMSADSSNVNAHVGYGEAVVDPNVLTFMNFSHATNINNYLEFHKMVLGLPSSFRNISNISDAPTWWDAYFSANTFRSLLGGRRPVVYPEVTVYHGHPYDFEECKSKTVYRYDIYSYQLSSIIHYLSNFNQTPEPDTAYFEPLYYFANGYGLKCMDYPAKRHQLKSRSDYSFDMASQTWNLVSEDKYLYNTENLSVNGFTFGSSISRGHCGRHTVQMAFNRPLETIGLHEFYDYATQKLGRFTLGNKQTTTLREGGTLSKANMQKEYVSNLYSGIPKTKGFTDFNMAIRIDYLDSLGYDKEEVYSYAGEEYADLFSGQENPDSVAHVLAVMRSMNMLTPVTSTELITKLPADSLISGTKIIYKTYSNMILPYKLYQNNGNEYEESLEIKSYDAHANPTEIIDLKTGLHSVFLWDTYGRYLIAMIKNATMTQIQNVIPQLMEETSQTRYATLLSLLPNAQIQTWDYLPLTGVSSYTNVTGETTLYEYDGLGRLKTEKRVVNGQSTPELIHEYEYNFLNQQP